MRLLKTWVFVILKGKFNIIYMTQTKRVRGIVIIVILLAVNNHISLFFNRRKLQDECKR